MNSSIFQKKTLAIAAAALIILFIGGFLISGNQPVQSQQTVRTYKAPVTATQSGETADTKTANKIDPPVVVEKPKPAPQKKAIKKSPAKKSETATVATPDAETTPLNEMVVMGIIDKRNTTPADSAAHPKIGWNNFENYLKEHAVTVDGKTGSVKVTFTVNANGSCTDFKIKSSLTKSADQKAIELIKNGSMWIGNADGSFTETTVDVNFHK